MEIPKYLIDNIRSGKACLMLGAGASVEARNDQGTRAPSGKELGCMIAKRFVSEDISGYPLNQIAEIAISETDLVTIQEYIREILEPFNPTQAHKGLSQFQWHGIATTNYDRLVEKAYQEDNVLHEIVTFIDNSDRINEKLRRANALPYLKLHGCITRTSNREAPLILAIEQYVEYRDGRSRVFDQFRDWCYEHPIVFVGYSFQDQNIRQILLEIGREVPSHPKFYLVTPDCSAPFKRLWGKKNIDVLDGTFNDFIDKLQQEIDSPFRFLKIQRPIEKIPISDRFTIKCSDINEELRCFLETDAEYVKEVKVDTDVDPKDFYKGKDLGWASIQNNYDVRRGLTDSILSEHIIDSQKESRKTQFIVIKAHAGAGKKTLLRRLAWEASFDYDCLCLYIKPYGQLSSVALHELVRLTSERIFIFVENAPSRPREIINFINTIGDMGKWITILATARKNEWNVYCETLSEHVTNEYELKYLSHRDISNLLELLKAHNALGTLKQLTLENQKKVFCELAGRQLLVALHEATLGKPFEEIIVDEYRNITPFDAQKMYMTICTLNRFSIPVRAGLISRIHNIRFEEFKTEFFSPLEQLVEVAYNPTIRDYEYVARHAHIAEIVFLEVLSAQEDRYSEYLRCLKNLNTAYQSDRKAFFQLIRANALMEVFSDYTLISNIYKCAYDQVGDDGELYHQTAIFEMKRDDGNFTKANQYLEKAVKLSPENSSIIHSTAELKLRFADEARTDLEFNKFIAEAQNICHQNKKVLDSYAISTLIKAELKKLKRGLSRGENGISDNEIDEIVKVIEKYLEIGLQQYSNDPHIYHLEAELASYLSDSKRVISALKCSCESNPRNSYCALRLSKCLKANGDINQALNVLKRAIEANSTKKELHYTYGKLLLESDTGSSDSLEYHFRRSYSPGDKNYDAQLLHGRQLYVNGNYEESKKIFDVLGSVRLPFKLKMAHKYPVDDIFNGEVSVIEATFCFIRRDGIFDRIYCHSDNVDNEEWNKIRAGTRLTFEISFNLSGPIAINVNVE